MTIEAIISENISVQNFQRLLRTMTKACMEETMMVRIVAQTVTIRELPKTRQNFIFAMAAGKFFIVKPCAPMSASGLDVMSAFVLKTLMITRMNGAMKATNRTRSTTHIMAWEIFFCRAALSFSVIMLPPLLSYRS